MPVARLGYSAGMAVQQHREDRELGQNVGMLRAMRYFCAFKGTRRQQVAEMNRVFCVGKAMASNCCSFCTLFQSWLSVTIKT